MSSPTRRILLALLIAISIGIATTGIVFRIDLREARVRVATGSTVVTTACGPIEYARVGTGTPVLMVHGAGGGFDQGLAFAQPLIEAGYSVIAPSRFGYLRTPLAKDSSIAAQARAHICLLDALHVGGVIALGGSAGAPSVIELCHRHPERCAAMILMVPAITPRGSRGVEPISPRAQKVIEAALSSDLVFWLASHLIPDTVIANVLGTPAEDVIKAGATEQHRVRTILHSILPISQRAAGLRNDTDALSHPSDHAFEQIPTPTLIATTENDGFNTAPGSREAHSRLPNSQLFVLPDGGHLWVGHQEQMWRIVEQFLTTLPAWSAS